VIGRGTRKKRIIREEKIGFRRNEEEK